MLIQHISVTNTIRIESLCKHLTDLIPHHPIAGLKLLGRTVMVPVQGTYIYMYM